MGEPFLLQTERLRLRRLTLADAGLMLSIWNDPDFVRHVGDRGIRSVDEARQALLDGAFRLYAEFGYGPYRVALREADTPIGTCGLFRREGLTEPDIGFALLPEYCGRGYAYEAATAVLQHARESLKLRRLTAVVSPNNDASIRLIEKLGLSFEKRARIDGDDTDVQVYGMSLT
ncbi:MAG: GNAT family N-acetyltransferase, partial [Gammaproteobacteria bacterium]|nr:GNAT family N-acetyltransferase [Gammaproteobacteria bacterium]